MYLPEVYVGLGGNIGDSFSILCKAIEEIANLPLVYDLSTSQFYRTSPVSLIPQDPYINAVCRFKTHFTIRELFKHLQNIEYNLGKKKKLKDAPRIIDLDILFFGKDTCEEPDLQIPHPRWSERLFVLIPLANLVTNLSIPDPKNPCKVIQFDVQKYLEDFPNVNQEVVTPYYVNWSSHANSTIQKLLCW